jgi:hypothetical protein
MFIVFADDEFELCEDQTRPILRYVDDDEFLRSRGINPDTDEQLSSKMRVLESKTLLLTQPLNRCNGEYIDEASMEHFHN